MASSSSTSGSGPDFLIHRVRNLLRRMRTLLDQLGWKDDSLDNRPAVKQCVVDPGHRVPLDSYHKHVRRCRLRRLGYNDVEIAKIRESSRFYYEDSTNVVRIVVDKNMLNEILQKLSGSRRVSLDTYRLNKSLPLSSDRALVDLTPPERRAIYDNVIRLAENHRNYVDLANIRLPEMDYDLEFASFGGNIAEVKPVKRHPVSYRGNPVHSSNKSYMEVVREVIANQMTAVLPAHETVVVAASNHGYLAELPGGKDCYNQQQPLKFTSTAWKDKVSQQGGNDYRKRAKRSRSRSRDRSESHRRKRQHDHDRYKHSHPRRKHSDK